MQERREKRSKVAEAKDDNVGVIMRWKKNRQQEQGKFFFMRLTSTCFIEGLCWCLSISFLH